MKVKEKVRNCGLSVFFSVIFIVIVSSWMIVSVVSGAVIAFQKYDEKSSKWVAEELYPYEKGNERVKNEKTLKELILWTEKKIESALQENNYVFMLIELTKKSLDRFIYGYNLSTSLSGTRNDPKQFTDVVVKHEKGVLSFVVDNIDISLALQKIEKFAKECKYNNIPFLFFLSPHKNGNISSEYCDVYVDYGNVLTNQIRTFLDDKQIDYILMDKYFEEYRLSENEIFFKTDNHWLPQNGVVASELIRKWINKGSTENISVYGKFYETTYNNKPMMGSLGRKVTHVYTDTEYLPLVKQREGNNVTLFISGHNRIIEGISREVLYDTSKIESDNLYGNDQYELYSYGNQGLIQIHNNDCDNNVRVLFIKESFANCILPFICNTQEYVDAIDLRIFSGSLKTYIHKNRPDYIVLVYGIGSFINDSTSNYSVSFCFD